MSMTARPTLDAQAVDHDMPVPGCQATGKLAGKAAIITDGDFGIGQKATAAYATGCTGVAAVFDQSVNDAAKTCRPVERQGLSVQADASSKAECTRAVAEAVMAPRQLDVLLAAFTGAPVDESEEADPRRISEVNVPGHVFTAQATLPHLERVGGCVIDTPRSTSLLGTSGAVLYPSAEGTVDVFTKSLAPERDENAIRDLGSFAMPKRAGQPEEITPAHVFLAAGAFVGPTGGFRGVD